MNILEQKINDYIVEVYREDYFQLEITGNLNKFIKDAKEVYSNEGTNLITNPDNKGLQYLQIDELAFSEAKLFIKNNINRY